MNDQRTSYGTNWYMFFGTKDLYLDSNCFSCEEKTRSLHLVLVGLTAAGSWQAGRLVDERWLDFEILEILHKINYLDFNFAVLCY